MLKWHYDIPTGTWMNHAISAEIRFAAVADSKIMGFCRPEPGYGRGMGESVMIQRIRNMTVPTSAVFSEGDRIPEDEVAFSKIAITPEQLGRALPYSDLSLQLNNFDLEMPIQRKLKDQMQLVLDVVAATAFKTAKVKAIPTGAAAITWDTDGTASTSATANLGVEHCGVIRDYMTDTLHVPFYNMKDDTYVGLGSTKLLRGIKNDPLFTQWKQYLREGDALYNSEVGKIEGIRWVEINYTSSLSNALGTGSVLGEGLVFGDDGVALAEIIAPHLRAAQPANFGLHKSIAWYANLACGLVWDTNNDGEARVIHITSS